MENTEDKRKLFALLDAKRREAASLGEPILREKSFKLLLEKVKFKAPERILEIGVNCGFSGIGMLLTSEKSRLTGIEIDEGKVEKAKKNYRLFGVEKRAKIFLGDAGEIIPLLTGKYDFIFLDGPKGHYAEYCPYLMELLNGGGAIFADNVLFRGYVRGEVKTPHRFVTTKNSMEKYLSLVTDTKGFKTEISDIEDGVAWTEKYE